MFPCGQAREFRFLEVIAFKYMKDRKDPSPFYAVVSAGGREERVVTRHLLDSPDFLKRVSGPQSQYLRQSESYRPKSGLVSTQEKSLGTEEALIYTLEQVVALYENVDITKPNLELLERVNAWLSSNEQGEWLEEFLDEVRANADPVWQRIFAGIRHDFGNLWGNLGGRLQLKAEGLEIHDEMLLEFVDKIRVSLNGWADAIELLTGGQNTSFRPLSEEIGRLEQVLGKSTNIGWKLADATKTNIEIPGGLMVVIGANLLSNHERVRKERQITSPAARWGVWADLSDLKLEFADNCGGFSREMFDSLCRLKIGRTTSPRGTGRGFVNMLEMWRIMHGGSLTVGNWGVRGKRASGADLQFTVPLYRLRHLESGVTTQSGDFVIQDWRN